MHTPLKSLTINKKKNGTVDLGYNNTGCNDNLVKATQCHGIDKGNNNNYFIPIIVTFSENFNSFREPTFIKCHVQGM